MYITVGSSATLPRSAPALPASWKSAVLTRMRWAAPRMKWEFEAASPRMLATWTTIFLSHNLWKTERILKESEALIKRWEKHPRVNSWLTLRQIIVNTEPLRIQVAQLAKSLDTGVHTHLCGGTYEVDFTVENYQMCPPEYFEKT